MSTPKKHRPARSQIIPLLIYTLLLCGIYAVYATGSRYELFMQSIDTLWPVIAFTLLLILVLGNALLLARGIRLWLLCALHMVLAGAWLASLQIAVINNCRAHDYGHVCAIIPPWLILICMALSTLPPLLGYALLQLRRRMLQKAPTADTAELSFQDAADILGDEEAVENDHDAHRNQRG